MLLHCQSSTMTEVTEPKTSKIMLLQECNIQLNEGWGISIDANCYPRKYTWKHGKKSMIFNHDVVHKLCIRDYGIRLVRGRTQMIISPHILENYQFYPWMTSKNEKWIKENVEVIQGQIVLKCPHTTGVLQGNKSQMAHGFISHKRTFTSDNKWSTRNQFTGAKMHSTNNEIEDKQRYKFKSLFCLIWILHNNLVKGTVKNSGCVCTILTVMTPCKRRSCRNKYDFVSLTLWNEVHVHSFELGGSM